jgi:hypothetical protein
MEGIWGYSIFLPFGNKPKAFHVAGGEKLKIDFPVML